MWTRVGPGEPLVVGVPATDDERKHTGHGHGCVMFRDADGRALHVLATADLARALERHAPADGPAESEKREPGVLGGRPRPDLSELAVRAEVYRSPSAFEADLAFLELARRESPGVFAEVAAGLGLAWFTIDPSARAPAWATVASHRDVARSSEGGVRFGPFRSPGDARAVSESLDELFDLCRYPVELARRPKGRACAYFDMGRCPAACDGSEPYDAYATRLADAIAAMDQHAITPALDRATKEAAARTDFERAADLRSRRDAVERALACGPVLSRATGDSGYAAIGLFVRGRTRWEALGLREGVVAVVGGGRLGELSDPDRDGAALIERVWSEAFPQPAPGSERDTALGDAVTGLVCREVASARVRRTRGRWFSITRDTVRAEDVALSAALGEIATPGTRTR